MMKSVLALLMALGLFAAATSSAHAGTVAIKYSLTGGSLSTPSPFQAIPIIGGMFTVRYTAATKYSKLTGPATLLTFSAVGVFNGVAPGASPDLLYQVFSLSLVGAVGGTGTAGSYFHNAVAAIFTGAKQEHCAGLTCTGAYGIASSLGLSGPFSVIVPASALQINASTATAMGVGLTGMFGGSTVGTGALSFIGNEVGRTFVPEPGAFPFLAIGGVLLAAYGWRRLRA